MGNEWIERWQVGRTGWHEPDGNRNLKRYWSETGRRVLVPLCGKSPDLLWLESLGNEVVGVELSPLAAEAFFAENDLAVRCESNGVTRYVADDRRVTIACGDYFDFATREGERFDACYDRGALVALSSALRERYVAHTRALLEDEAYYLLVSLEYDQAVADGPPYSLAAGQVDEYFPELERIAAIDDLENCPPKFREAGLEAFDETIWTGQLTKAPR